MSLIRKINCIAAALSLLVGCGGGGDSSNTGDTTNTLVHVATYDLTSRYQDGNYLLDQDKIIFAGGQIGEVVGAQHDGHPAFSDQVYVIDLATSTKSSYTVSAESGHVWDGGTVANGIGNQTIVRKLSNGKYLIYGGFQYVEDTFILDLNQADIQTYKTDITVTDDTGLNTTGFYANNQASAVFENGDFAFFGFNNGLYGMGAIILFDVNNTLSYRWSNASLTIGRSNVDAYLLSDGRVLLVGGWDGTGSTSPSSATRRAELYDPSLDTIERIADYPEPKSNSQHRSNIDIVTANEVCVDGYKYNISDNLWSVGCDITMSDNAEVNYSLPDDYRENVSFVGRASNGQLVFIEQNPTTLEFSDECSCYPYSEGVKVHVFSED